MFKILQVYLKIRILSYSKSYNSVNLANFLNKIGKRETYSLDVIFSENVKKISFLLSKVDWTVNYVHSSIFHFVRSLRAQMHLRAKPKLYRSREGK